MSDNYFQFFHSYCSKLHRAFKKKVSIQRVNNIFSIMQYGTINPTTPHHPAICYGHLNLPVLHVISYLHILRQER